MEEETTESSPCRRYNIIYVDEDIPEGLREHEGRNSSQTMTSGESEYTQASGRPVTEGTPVSEGRLGLDTLLSSVCPGMG